MTLHPLGPSDLTAVLDLWVAAWAATLPEIDFEARRPWMRERLEQHLADGAAGIVARDAEGALAGFAVVNPGTRYLDQIAVAPHLKGSGTARLLLDAARRISPEGLDLHVNIDNPRAVRFYEREGFVRLGEGVNPRSGLPIAFYRWTPA